MRKVVALGAAAAAMLMSATLAGCASSGLDRDRPDEFAVARQPSLIIPPDFALVPPTPGAARVQSVTGAQAQTLEALFGSAPRSASEAAVVQSAGGATADPGIRSSAGDPSTNVVDKGQTTRDIIAAPEGDGQDARANAPK
ncbi:DUF3035 domain-containing protein [Sphingomonas sp. NBWT7]|uniref:DUF3035 domain-containing protein n=1 Tax=Sphingomonas sp. NBWT7 TaxID=2596913 RepID=UPI0016247390|nr:DUF3035 domain-containing protein [Sphingomonas sp. NBWT7]QNE30664.1 DUF3035 domain-containing protein [Sphingomonas sp. NBWT7]